MILAHNFGDISLYAVGPLPLGWQEGWHTVHGRAKLFMAENKKNEEGKGTRSVT